MGLAVMSWATGDTVWTMTIGNDPSPPAPSFADLGYLGVYPLAYVSLILLLRSRMGSLRSGLWLDGVIGAFAVAALGTAALLPAIVGALGGSPASVATNLAYPLADVILIALVVWGLALTGWRPGRTWGCLAAGLLVFAISDCLYLYYTATGSYVEGSATDLGWAAGAVLLAWAAWQPERPAGRAKPESWSILVPPVAFGLIALGIQVYDHFERVNPLALVLSAAALLAVIVRMAITFAENMAMIGSSRAEARTDSLTGLGNRRRLFDDLEELFARPDMHHVLILFDLNGFKFYNDTFGHIAGDLLLARLGASLHNFVRGRGEAYRMGGDEFCIVVQDIGSETELVVAGAVRALSEHGEGFTISAASGSIALPAEAQEADEALRLADQRMYARKQSSRVSAGDQSSGVLLRALTERHPKLGAHVSGVGQLAEDLARKMNLSEKEIELARLTGGLHDVGKMAIPDEILEKPGPLDRERVAVPARPVDDRRADPARRARPDERGGFRPLEPRAVRRNGLPRRARGHRHPAHLAHRLRLRRVRRDDVAPAVRRRAHDRSGALGAQAERGHAVRPAGRLRVRRRDRRRRRAARRPRVLDAEPLEAGAQADAPVRQARRARLLAAQHGVGGALRRSSQSALAISRTRQRRSASSKIACANSAHVQSPSAATW